MTLRKLFEEFQGADEALKDTSLFSFCSRSLEITKLNFQDQKEIIDSMLSNGEIVYRYSKADKLTEPAYIFVSIKWNNISLSVGTITIPPKRKARNRYNSGIDFMLSRIVQNAIDDLKNKKTEKLDDKNGTLLAYVILETKRMNKTPIPEKNNGHFVPEIYNTWEKVEKEFDLHYEKELEKLELDKI